MKFNPIKKLLFTNDGVLIKKLHCPYGIKWDSLPSKQLGYKSCSICDKHIFDISHMSDDQLMKFVENDPKICLKLDICDPNIRVVNHNAS